MEQPCPHCDHPDLSLLRLVLMGELLRTEETQLLLLADLLLTCGLLHGLDAGEVSAIPTGRGRPAARHGLRHSGVDDQEGPPGASNGAHHCSVGNP